jgi:hypothetical protein
MTPPTTLTIEALRASMLRCLRSSPLSWVGYEDCPECGDSLLTVIEDGCVFDGEPAVCCSCRRVWSWSVDEYDAWINDQREPDEDVPKVTPGTLAAILAQVQR